jgi:DMSO/TMAO reductase YedYZ heme-binding membrane subunit
MNETELNPILKFWLNTFSFGGLVFLFVCYYYFFQGDDFSLQLINKATASTAIILMGASFALSSLGFYWDFLDKKVAYRKYLGLVGYFFVLWHGLNSLYFYFLANTGLEKFILHKDWIIFSFTINNRIPFILGALSLLIFTMMALISNNYATKKIGGVRWRKLLRVGYIALLFALIHFTIKNFEIWINWFKDGANTLPQMSSLLAFYILIILILRISLQISLIRKQKAQELQDKVEYNNSDITSRISRRDSIVAPIRKGRQSKESLTKGNKSQG